MLRRSIIILAVLAIPAAVGCRGPWTKQQVMTPLPAATNAPSTLITSETSSKSREQALAEVLDELTEIGAIDPEAKRLLMAELREAKPEEWPLIVRSFQSALAYRKQLAEREQKAAADMLASKQQADLTTELLVAKQRTASSLEQTNMPKEPPSEPATRPQAVAVSFETNPSNSHLEPQLTATAVSNISANTLRPVESEPVRQVAQQTSYVTAVHQPRDWQGHLHSAVTDFKAKVQPSPGSTDEVNEHMRLRLLQLLAGDEEAALGTIPGATAPQQDYWNKQLFAVSTFLDSGRLPDDKRRAASSLMHLDQARAKLAELATMQVRKLSFVDSVYGYGDYEVHRNPKFRPGDRVTLYAEVENYTSESTKEGYRTRLGTSYEVVDKNGKRVDSAQLPEVTDLCRNPRRDFHMQYTVTLPTRIYNDTYELRLTITDQQSHKIGQASVPFDIIE